ncbi:Hypothetical predicted protein [Octopus vulgaris]|uniref:Uncharacterized protein n=1 Tax=Octopus vulgaris TaxID=6645 RepID=A0AA36FF50_OCTVU|nr:Hypothetical predicted protein [Octopus vulgaris]
MLNSTCSFIRHIYAKKLATEPLQRRRDDMGPILEQTTDFIEEDLNTLLIGDFTTDSLRLPGYSLSLISSVKGRRRRTIGKASDFMKNRPKEAVFSGSWPELPPVPNIALLPNITITISNIATILNTCTTLYQMKQL